ncbi:HlyD family secretion protein [Scytonema sp. HK-05]|nr:HlyD family secretion protein [Scytonema sp. HK-05]
MPHPSNNSSSPFTPTDDQQLSTPLNSVEENNAVAVNAKDWFYGTEELLDALPRLWTRSLLYLLIGFSAIALPWAMLSQVDETGTARGRIEPLGATQRLDSQVTASITAVKSRFLTFSFAFRLASHPFNI